MAITERELPASNQWEIKATGEDVGKLAGMLTETGNEAYRKAFHSNEGQYVKVTDPHGNPTQVHQKDLDQALASGYGQSASAPRMVMPSVPWARKVSGPGKHKFRYDKASKSMVEVS
jgi:hypothetical protein